MFIARGRSPRAHCVAALHTADVVRDVLHVRSKSIDRAPRRDAPQMRVRQKAAITY